jgi:hypothetical protein
LVAATALAALGGSGISHRADLDPGNADPNGARAIARVLADQGIEVDVVRNAAELAAARIDAGTTVVVTSTADLGQRAVAELTRVSRDADLVLVDPRYGVPQMFGAAEGIGYTETRTAVGSCFDPTYAHLRIESNRGTMLPATGDDCFPTGDGALITHPRPGLTFLGATDLLANDQITVADNAAVALRLLGQYDHLVWYVPDPADQSGQDGVSFSSLLPKWLGPGAVLLGGSLIALVWWRGRRLGALVVEPLPVTVTAIETTLSRGRLYRKAGDRGHAAQALRQQARTAVAEQLGLARWSTTDLDGLVNALAAHTVVEPTQLRTLLNPAAPAPTSDRALITLANELAALIREVRRS